MNATTDEAIDLERRFGGLARLYGQAGAQRLAQAHVAVIGIGGVGSWAAEALARSAVSQITLIDLDNVAESNINRQIHAHTLSLGQPKVSAMHERIRLINPYCAVHEVEDFVDPDNVAEILSAAPLTAVIDACDQIKAKAAIANWCMGNKTPFIAVGAAGGRQQAELLEIADLGQVTHDPLLAQLRYQMRKRYEAERKPGKKMHIPCVFSKESIKRADASCNVQTDNSLNCAGYGSSVTVTASFGMAAAGWIIQKIISA